MVVFHSGKDDAKEEVKVKHDKKNKTSTIECKNKDGKTGFKIRGSEESVKAFREMLGL